MRYLVFGANGQVGQALQAFPGVRALGRHDADLALPGECSRAIKMADADVVINAAAYTAVDKAEVEEKLACRINGAAVEEMARSCREFGLPFLHISTDYVFNGSSSRPYKETAETSPMNAYGRSKLVGEKAVQEVGGKWAVLRTSWVFSAYGSNFVKTMLRLSKTHSQLNIVEDQIGGPTAAADIAKALIAMGRAMAGGHPGGLYHFAGCPAVSWADFAREIFMQAGRAVSVHGIPSSAYPAPAARPANSRLDCRRLGEDFGIVAPNWRQSLASSLKELEEKT